MFSKKIYKLLAFLIKKYKSAKINANLKEIKKIICNIFKFKKFLSAS